MGPGSPVPLFVLRRVAPDAQGAPQRGSCCTAYATGLRDADPDNGMGVAQIAVDLTAGAITGNAPPIRRPQRPERGLWRGRALEYRLPTDNAAISRDPGAPMVRLDGTPTRVYSLPVGRLARRSLLGDDCVAR